MILEISNEIEEALKKEELVGRRLGSGFCLLDNSRDVQFEYSSNEVKDYFSKIEKVINEFTEKYKDYEIVICFRNDSFSFYVKPIEKSEDSGPIPEAPAYEAEESADENIDTESYRRGWQDCVKEMMEKLKSIKNK